MSDLSDRAESSGSAALAALSQLPVVGMLWGAGPAAGLFHWWRGPRRPQETAP